MNKKLSTMIQHKSQHTIKPFSKEAVFLKGTEIAGVGDSPTCSPNSMGGIFALKSVSLS